MTKNPQVRFAKSIVDYVFRWLAAKFLSAEAQYRVGINVSELAQVTQEEGPPCKMCGSITARSGSYWKCPNCGSVQGGTS